MCMLNKFRWRWICMYLQWEKKENELDFVVVVYMVFNGKSEKKRINWWDLFIVTTTKRILKYFNRVVRAQNAHNHSNEHHKQCIFINTSSQDCNQPEYEFHTNWFTEHEIHDEMLCCICWIASFCSLSIFLFVFSYRIYFIHIIFPMMLYIQSLKNRAFILLTAQQKLCILPERMARIFTVISTINEIVQHFTYKKEQLYSISTKSTKYTITIFKLAYLWIIIFK